MLAAAFSLAVPEIMEAQTRRRRARRPARAPVVQPVKYTTTRNTTDLRSALASLTVRTRSGSWGAMVVSLTRGDTLFAQNAGVAMLPASTQKVLTSAIAFERFGPNYQFSTDALRDGDVGSDGTLNGNLYLRGDGDPAL